jgi:hypothetical protein
MELPFMLSAKWYLGRGIARANRPGSASIGSRLQFHFNDSITSLRHILSKRNFIGVRRLCYEICP